jgi:hypothetical protein
VRYALSPTDQILELNTDQKRRLDAYINRSSQTWLNTGANDEEAVSNAVAGVYSRLGRKRPHILWADSPWQLAVMPFLLRLVCFHSSSDAQRRLLRRNYDRSELYKQLRLELAANLNEDLWAAAYSNLMAQLTPEIELALAQTVSETKENPLVSVGRALGLRLETIMGEAHKHLRRYVALNIIEDVDRRLNLAWRPIVRARMLLERQLSFRIGRRFSDFNASIRGSLSVPLCHLPDEFIRQVGRDFAIQVARLLTEDDVVFLPTHANMQQLFRTDQDVRNRMQQIEIAEQMLDTMDGPQPARLDAHGEARLVQSMTEDPLTWASWSQDFFRMYLFPLHVFGNVIYDADLRQELDDLTTLRTGAFMFVFDEPVVFACKNPLAIRLDEQEQLHSYTNPAIEFLDGFSLYSWQGVSVPESLVHTPELLTVKYIENERNTELRRVLIERYGAAKFLIDAGAVLISEDECGALFSKQMPGDEALVMVRVRNSTPEPDGTYKDYFLRVPPDLETPRAAVAWTFGLDPDEYNPSIQT